MLTTEKEAKTKWCPMVRHGEICGPDSTVPENLEPVAWNRFDGEWNFGGLLCIASGCMMWSWGDLPECLQIMADCSENKAPERPRNIPTTWKYVLTDERTHRLNAPVMVGRWVEPDTERDARRLGYCGLAGDGGQE